jgi:hypothetical protein
MCVGEKERRTLSGHRGGESELMSTNKIAKNTAHLSLVGLCEHDKGRMVLSYSE